MQTIDDKWASSTPAAVGAALVNGSALTVARSDHVHNIGAGTVSLPGVPVGEAATGLYRPGSGQLGVAVSGAAAGLFQANGLQEIAGAVGAPSFSFTGDTNTGLYSSAADELAVTAGGVQVATFQSNGVRVANGAVGTPAVSFTGDTDTGLYNVGANQIGVATGGALRGTWSSSGLTMGTNLPVVPGAISGTPAANAGYQESLVKGWIKVGVAADISDSFNVSSVSDRGTGQVDINWDRDFGSANYAMAAIIKATTGALTPAIDATQGQAAGTVTIDAFNAAGSVTDPVFYEVIAIGKQ